MTQTTPPSAYGEWIEPATLKISRLLPGPIERVWAYLTESELRRTWLAGGEMPMKVGSEFQLTWRNDELSDPAGQRPEGFPAEHHMDSEIIEVDPPYKLSFTWSKSDHVTFELAPKGNDVVLTVTHRRLPDHKTKLMVGAGWHMHLDVLVARMYGTTTEPFWDGWTRLTTEYERRTPL